MDDVLDTVVQAVLDNVVLVNFFHDANQFLIQLKKQLKPCRPIGDRIYCHRMTKRYIIGIILLRAQLNSQRRVLDDYIDEFLRDKRAIERANRKLEFGLSNVFFVILVISS